MNNQELIKECREDLDSEDSPSLSALVDMIECLCNALEKADNNIKYYEEIERR